MTGLELARAYWETYGVPMIHDQFPEYEEIVAAALTGSGSECYGFDDEVSRDHDFEPGFCLFIPEEEIVDRRTAFQMERAYAKLPAEFEGFRRQKLQPVGGQRHGLFRIDEYFTDKIGCPPEQMTTEQWLRIPEYALAEAVNGEVFRDPAGLLTDCRKILEDMPEDIRRKRLAGRLLLMAQSGQYNYQRCLKHGETGAAQLAVGEFARNTLSAVFLLNRKYMPYYKWSFRALKALPGGEDLGRSLEWLLTTENGKELAEDKYFCMEEIASQIIGLLQEQGLTEATCGDLEKHAYSVNDGIRDGSVRNLHVLYCV
ncbi:DUF4037 domain-containing protein [Aristaeella lactis]|uniref:Uncharacterized protein n=1 Tax=Aristaeella lactis TaxID=3046383 RepID=A0AC61PJM3_9FIRM|nr:DUF4037 domain-containing protein [Aristaeella lactis]QUA51664.1 DUF4037 domain-containing protein [Aristaeella lactis]SMC48696.1 protein of unknown function [Aristaeella lactis]